jgi:hypothetical protein
MKHDLIMYEYYEHFHKLYMKYCLKPAITDMDMLEFEVTCDAVLK